MKLSILFLLAASLRAQDAKINPDKPAENVTISNPELDAAKARIELLEQALDAMANKSQACFALYGADMKLADLLPRVKQAQAEALKRKPDSK